MTDRDSTMRGLVVYAMVLPLAVLLGYLLAGDIGLMAIGTLGLLTTLLSLPLLLKWHHPMLFLTWNMGAMLFFLPGRPYVWLAVAFVSLGISIVKRSVLREMHFIYAPSIVMPVFFLGLVVLMTAKLTGGIGVAALGSETVGGKRYILMFAAMAGFMAMLGEKVPPHRIWLYVAFFFLGGLTNMIGSLASYVSPSLYWLFQVFPVTTGDLGTLAVSEISGGVARFYGSTIAAEAIFCYVLARYGIRQILAERKLPQILLLIMALGLGTLGGFRGILIFLAMLFLLVFYLEGLFRTKYALLITGMMIMAGAMLVPFAQQLPASVQRSISFLPVEIDYAAKRDAENSSKWRLEMWKEVLPEVPKHLWLGKGLAISGQDLERTRELQEKGRLLSKHEGTILAGDYHNGPLTTIIPFGIWGAIGCLWLFLASLRALYLNYAYGEDYLKKINLFLLAYYTAKIAMFLLIFGNFNSDLAQFLGIVGLGLALNGGICKPVRVARTWANAVNIKFGMPAKPVPGYSGQSSLP